MPLIESKIERLTLCSSSQSQSGPHDEEIDPQTVRELKVTVGSVEVRNAETASDLPEREGDYKKLSAATSGKPAGSKEEDNDD